jgi:F420-dependent oxidoreductase-like protein
MAALSFGIKTAPQHTTYEAIRDVWLAADRHPIYEHAWLFDHFAPIAGDLSGPCYEGWSLLAALAAQTSRIRLGLMVTGNTYRHPAVLANIAATVDIVSAGRLDLGIGAGWNEYEHESMGLPLYAPGERIRRLGEACEMISRLLDHETKTVDFDGRYYQLKAARCEPKPVQRHVPIVIGGSGEKLTLNVVARYADIWNFVGGPVDEFKRKTAILHEHCAAVGRDPAAIQLSIQQQVNYQDLAATAATINGYVAEGATHICLNLRYPYPPDIIDRMATELIPRVGA